MVQRRTLQTPRLSQTLMGSLTIAKPDVSTKLVSSPLSVFEFFDMIHHHKLLGKNCFSPLSELGSDSKGDDMLLLDWVNSTGSSKDEDGRNALDVVPLAKWDPYKGLELVSEEVALDVFFFVEDDLEPSVWVNRMIKGFGKFEGFPIDLCEKQCIAFFQKLEKVWEKQTIAGSLRRTASSTKNED
ncbi:hypothetical protein CMV_016695 [Castanea mollissima]|uniref:Uncharacterized protein n=1 Tax=Castanea mollissima TaxID=60419 RepID=A0A8J4QTG8_9ROSI|nr:hypothetical protein CMV_016695 [Castanea mollissima]